jgi:hypothetical protein
LTVAKRGPYCPDPIRHRHLKQLVRTAASLPGPRIDLAPWERLAQLEVAPAEADDGAAAIARLRAAVHQALAALGARIDGVLPPVLAQPWRNWDTIDDLSIVDESLATTLAHTRRLLVAAARGPARLRAVAFEGLLALDAARGLTTLAEHGLASLIRLRVRAGEEELMPEGRPFLDLGNALAEAARAWA